MPVWNDVESDAASRILAAAELFYQNPDDVPEALRTVSGDVQERSAKRLQAVAAVLEYLVLESVETGLSDKLKGYSSVPLLRAASAEDLEEVLGLDKSTVKALRERLTRHFPKSSKRPEGEPPDLAEDVAEEPPADLKELVEAVSGDDEESEKKVSRGRR